MRRRVVLLAAGALAVSPLAAASLGEAHTSKPVRVCHRRHHRRICKTVRTKPHRLTMLSSPTVRNAFDIAAEPEQVRRRYGRTTYGQGCLLARRLVEAGVKFVTVYFASSIGGQSRTEGGWDTHGFNDTHMYPILKSWHLPQTDRTLPTFLNDLDERGLLDSTLVVWMGEFGRTPKLNAQTSRDHWPQCYTVLLAGGGVKRGYIHGRSDRQGAYPDRDGVPLEDLAATMFALLGIDPQTELLDRLNRPHPVAAGRAVPGIMA